jgi:hypothetical protein
MWRGREGGEEETYAAGARSKFSRSIGTGALRERDGGGLALSLDGLGGGGGPECFAGHERGAAVDRSERQLDFGRGRKGRNGKTHGAKSIKMAASFCESVFGFVPA